MTDTERDMTHEQRVFAHVQFRNRVLKANGQQFEDLFSAVMTKRNPKFRPVKPQGKKGDQGNDGFVAEDGRYYQVYAPEKPKEKVAAAMQKVVDDFRKLRKHWNEETPIREFYFVLNDKYDGAFPDVEHAVAELQREHNLEIAKPFLAKDLEAEFMALSSDDMALILGGVIPRSEFIQDIDFGALAEVLQHLVDNRQPLTSDEPPIVPDFGEKMRLNDIEAASSYLNIGNYQDAAVESFFNQNGEFTRKHIRDLMAEAYQAARDEPALGDETKPGDQVFFRLLDGIVPNADRQVQDAAIVLIAYFFEKCDVFEDPSPS